MIWGLRPQTLVRDAQFRSITEGPEPFFYLSYGQQDDTETFDGDSQTHIRLRAPSDATAMLSLLRRTIAEVDPNVPIAEDLLLSDRLDYHFRHLRAVRTMLATLGSLAVFLSAIALYTVLAIGVRERRREIAIRMALGAHRSTVSRLVVREGLALTGVGAVIGTAVALAVTRLLRTLLFGVSEIDAATFVAVTLVLTVVTCAACSLPAYRAARIDPMVVLRHE